MKEKILIIVLSELKFDARVRRQINAIKDHYDVTVASFNAEKQEGYKAFNLTPTPLTFFRKAVTSLLLLLRFYSLAYSLLHDYKKKILRAFDHGDIKLIIANDVETLPIAFAFKSKPKVLYDAHEYAPKHFEDRLMWRIFFQNFNIWLCKKYLSRTAAMMTVGKALANEYKIHFGVNPVVVHNANNFKNLTPSPINESSIRLVHVGIANSSRRLELSIEMLNYLDKRFTFDFYLLSPVFASRKTKQYLENLKVLAAKTGRARILPPIPGNELVETINQYDIGVFLLPPINFNYKNTLPNKLFDFIQARLAIAIGPTPEMAEIVREYKNGVVSKDFTPRSLAEELNKLTTEDIEKFKHNSAAAAKVYNAENSAKTILEMVQNILKP